MSLENSDSVFGKAERICGSVLKNNSSSIGFVAGGKVFSKANWTRDSLLASTGALRIGENENVEQNLEVIKSYQRGDGAIPNRIEQSLHLADFINVWPLNRKYDKPIAKFRSSQPWASETVDTSALYIIAAGEFRRTGVGEGWWVKNLESLNKAASWLKSKINGTGLVKEGFTASWKDSHLISGYIGYTNVCAWKAFEELGWKEDASKLRRAINENFWDSDKKYYINWISPKGKIHTEFSADVNVLAVALGLASKEQSIDVARFIEANSLNKIPIILHYPISDFRRDIWTKTLFPGYDASKGIFMWWGGWEAIVQNIVGEASKAKRDITKIADIISENNTSPELVDFQGKLLGSQRDMTWSAGVFLFALSELGLLGNV